ncbi:hypothetical protein ACOBQB_08770 [Streptomyces sp. G5(2025)]|uniref:hypothetical protein n=1 Tax=Streptomyces sp. G5(2025) TaxID=3406628 RepID=UPI003C2A77D6
MVRRVPLLAVGAVWWWGVLRLALAPDAGALEGAVAAGGWGLSLLPVHCVPKATAKAQGRRPSAWRGPSASGVALGRAPWGVGRERVVGVRRGPTKAWRRRRSGGGSGPS